MSLDPNPAYAAPDDWRAYSGVLSRRVFAFIIDYVIVLLLCIPAAVVVFSSASSRSASASCSIRCCS